jgi:transposase-like protein
MHKRKREAKITGTGASGKAIVMGILERHGPGKTSKVRTKVLTNRKRHALHTEVRQHVAPGSELFTDALASYYGLDREYVHKVIDHAESYAIGNVHTNGIENFWSLLKRAISGTYVSVEPFHLFRYLDEQSFRFNNRDGNNAARFLDLLSSVTGKRLTYKKLIGQDSTAASTTPA